MLRVISTLVVGDNLNGFIKYVEEQLPSWKCKWYVGVSYSYEVHNRVIVILFKDIEKINFNVIDKPFHPDDIKANPLNLPFTANAFDVELSNDCICHMYNAMCVTDKDTIMDVGYGRARMLVASKCPVSLGLETIEVIYM